MTPRFQAVFLGPGSPSAMGTMMCRLPWGRGEGKDRRAGSAGVAGVSTGASGGRGAGRSGDTANQAVCAPCVDSALGQTHRGHNFYSPKRSRESSVQCDISQFLSAG